MPCSKMYCKSMGWHTIKNQQYIIVKVRNARIKPRTFPVSNIRKTRVSGKIRTWLNPRLEINPVIACGGRPMAKGPSILLGSDTALRYSPSANWPPNSHMICLHTNLSDTFPNNLTKLNRIHSIHSIPKIHSIPNIHKLRCKLFHRFRHKSPPHLAFPLVNSTIRLVFMVTPAAGTPLRWIQRQCRRL
ncbi:hypothetical protein EX30DRAFT_173886 [Ascodesmis nigricans]|uniref:Uncharacterized protein n=1 Tax=Ascodesmis nigricans TaxID=341454 RepID=A0A4S2MLM2_9PEZI|nr:hypothetical protein EX30DRAFT_173886 [Ascodesmis nigricans]